MTSNVNIIDIRGHELYLIERILNRQESRDINNHFKKNDIALLANRYMLPVDLIRGLENKNLIYYSGDYAYVTDYGKRCLDHKYQKERDLINEHILDNYEYAFLEFMNNRNEPVPMFHFPIEFQIHSEKNREWMDDIYKYIIDPNEYGYILNSLGKSRFEKLKREKDLKVNRDNLEMQKLRGDVDIITNTLVDYDKVKGRLNRTEIVAWLSAVLLLLDLILQAKGCKSG